MTPMNPLAYPRSGYDSVGGLVFLPRLLDKARLHAAGRLAGDYNLGTGYDARCCRLLGLAYDDLAAKAREEADDAAVLAWCYEKGRRPSDDEIHYFNTFMTKRGWRDESSEKMQASKEKRGIAARDDIQTHFDLYDFDEGRK
jgi:gluconokinase